MAVSQLPAETKRGNTNGAPASQITSARLRELGAGGPSCCELVQGTCNQSWRDLEKGGGDPMEDPIFMTSFNQQQSSSSKINLDPSDNCDWMIQLD